MSQVPSAFSPLAPRLCYICSDSLLGSADSNHSDCHATVSQKFFGKSVPDALLAVSKSRAGVLDTLTTGLHFAAFFLVSVIFTSMYLLLSGKIPVFLCLISPRLNLREVALLP